MPKGWQRDLEKEQRWRQTFAEWERTGLSGAEYCRQHDLSYTQFNDWRKRIRQLDSEAASISRRQRVSARAQKIAEQIKSEEKPSRRRSIEFAEVQVIDHERPQDRAQQDEHATTLEIVFASGTKLRLSSGCPLDLLSSVVAILENR
jgi:hypothetical protein